VAAELLLDTGAFVALVDRDEKLYDNCVAALEGWTGPGRHHRSGIDRNALPGRTGRARAKSLAPVHPQRRLSVGPFVDEKSSASGPDGKVPKRPNGFRRRNFGCFGRGD
jgi:hypothetical protein